MDRWIDLEAMPLKNSDIRPENRSNPDFSYRIPPPPLHVLLHEGHKARIKIEPYYHKTCGRTVRREKDGGNGVRHVRGPT